MVRTICILNEPILFIWTVLHFLFFSSCVEWNNILKIKRMVKIHRTVNIQMHKLIIFDIYTLDITDIITY